MRAVRAGWAPNKLALPCVKGKALSKNVVRRLTLIRVVVHYRTGRCRADWHIKESKARTRVMLGRIPPRTGCSAYVSVSKSQTNGTCIHALQSVSQPSRTTRQVSVPSVSRPFHNAVSSHAEMVSARIGDGDDRAVFAVVATCKVGDTVVA